MSTAIPPVPAQNQETFGDDVAGMGSFFIDAEGAARRVFHKWFWIAPLIVVSIVSCIASLIRLPITQHAMETMPLPSGADPERVQRGIAMGMMFQRILVWFAPVGVAIVYAIEALIL